MIEPPDTTIVTGASGWLGTALLHALTGTGPHRRDGRIVALLHDGSDRDRIAAISPAITVVVGDVTEPATLAPLGDAVVGDVDLVHTAGIIHPRRVADFDRVNADGTRHVVEASRRLGVRRMVHVSSNSPFGTNSTRSDRFRQNEPYRPHLGYGRSKMAAELAVLDAVDEGLHAVIVRPPWFYGPHQPERQTTFFRLIRRGLFPILGDGGQRRSMVHVDNLVDGIVRAELTAGALPGSGWWIADARPYTVREIVDTVGRALAAAGLRVSPPRVRLPAIVGGVAAAADRSLQRAGLHHQQLHVLGELGATIACDIDAARRDLGYEPAIDLDAGMRDSVRWCLARGIEL